MLPAACRPLPLLRWLTIAAIALCLCTLSASAILGIAVAEGEPRFLSPNEMVILGLCAGVPTLLTASIWSTLLLQAEVLKAQPRWVMWLASLPLALFTTALGFVGLGWLLDAHIGDSPASDFYAGLSEGGWLAVPGLIVTLICFAGPIANYQRSHPQCLGIREKWLAHIGVRCIATFGLAIAICCAGLRSATRGYFPICTGMLAGTAGVWVVVLANRRARRRRAFVQAIQEGSIDGYRVQNTDEGSELVQVASLGEGYRASERGVRVLLLESSRTPHRVKREK
jgi:hypothetical protein